KNYVSYTLTYSCPALGGQYSNDSSNGEGGRQQQKQQNRHTKLMNDLVSGLEEVMKPAPFLATWRQGSSSTWSPHGRRITFVLRRLRFLVGCVLSFCAFMRQPAGAAPNR